MRSVVVVLAILLSGLVEVEGYRVFATKPSIVRSWDTVHDELFKPLALVKVERVSERGNESTSGFCAGSIIASKMILTTASCVYDGVNKRVYPAANILVFVGSLESDTTTNIETEFETMSTNSKTVPSTQSSIESIAPSIPNLTTDSTTDSIIQSNLDPSNGLANGSTTEPITNSSIDLTANANTEFSNSPDNETDVLASRGWAVARVKIHQHFVAKHNRNDLALLILAQSLDIDYITTHTVPLPMQKPNVGVWCYVLGWKDFYESGPRFEKAYATNLKIMDDEYCRNRTVKFSQRFLCASDTGEDANKSCESDNGGPLVCNGALAGVLAYQTRCQEEDLTMYFVNVQSYLFWIFTNGTSNRRGWQYWVLFSISLLTSLFFFRKVQTL